MNIIFLFKIYCSNNNVQINPLQIKARLTAFLERRFTRKFIENNDCARNFKRLITVEQYEPILKRSKYMELIPIKSKFHDVEVHRLPKTIMCDWYTISNHAENVDEIKQIQLLDKDSVQEFLLPPDNQITHRGETFKFVSAEEVDKTNPLLKHAIFVFEKTLDKNETLYIYKSVYDVFIVIRGNRIDVPEIIDIVLKELPKE